MSNNKSYLTTSQNVNEGRNIPDKITGLRNMAISYEMRLRGGVFSPAANSWVIKNKALAGEDFINQTTGILTSFCENVNLFTTKKDDKFLLEFADAFYRVNVFCLNDNSIVASNYRAVIKMFKDTLSNIGDVILGSKDSLKGVFEKYEAQNEEGEEF
jgi:hypothetical protein